MGGGNYKASEIDSAKVASEETWHRRGKLRRLIMPLVLVTTAFSGSGAILGWGDGSGDQGRLVDKQAEYDKFARQARVTADMIAADKATVTEACRVAAQPFISGDQREVDDLAAGDALDAPEVCGPGALRYVVVTRRDTRDYWYNEGRATDIQDHELPSLRADAASENEVWKGALFGAALGVAIVGLASRD